MQKKLLVSNSDIQKVLSCNITSVVVLKRFLFSDIETGAFERGNKKGMEVFALCARLKEKLGANWNIEHSAALVALAKPAKGSSV